MTQGTGLDVAPQHGPLVPDAAAVERARRRERLLLFTAMVLAALGLGLFVLDMFRFMPSNAWGFDLEAYLDAARRLARGDLAAGWSIYDQGSLEGPFRPGP